MTAEVNRQRRLFMSGAAGAMAGSVVITPVWAQRQRSATPDTLSIRLLDGMANTLNGAVIHVYAVPKGGARRAKNNNDGEYECPALSGAMMVSIQRTSDAPPELVLNRLWGPDYHRLVISLPGKESPESQMERATNIVSAIETLAVMGSLYPELRAAYTTSELQLRRYLGSAGQEVKAAAANNTDDQQAIESVLAQRLSLLQSLPGFGNA